MGFKCGIVGLPNVGKSTLFNALTRASIKVANFPFSTIEPNIGSIPVPDYRLDKLSEIVGPKYVLPSTIEFVDIAGLVEGASKGEGLGNRFLSKIRETDAIGHLVRCFKDEKTIHVTGKVNPAIDIDLINSELSLSDLNTCEHAILYATKKAKYGDKTAKAEISVLNKCLLHLENANMLRSLNLSKEDKKLIRYLNFLTLKPMMYLANVNENDIKNNPYLDQVYNIAENDNSIVIPVCAILEANMQEKHEKLIQRLDTEESSLGCIIRAGYELLNLHTYFTVGVNEVRAWSIHIGTTAQQAAGKIHSDFERGFIRAKTISYEDFIAYRGEQGAKKAGKIRTEGKNYIVRDGDILQFLFNV